MRTLVSCTNYTNFGFNTTQYSNMVGVLETQSLGYRTLRVKSPGTFSRLKVYITSNTCNGTQVVTIMKGGVATSMALTVPAATTGDFEDSVNSVASVANDTFEYRYVTGGTSGTCQVKTVSCAFDATTNTVQHWQTTQGDHGTTTTKYQSLSGSGLSGYVPENVARCRIRAVGTLRNSYVYVSSNGRTTAATVFTLRIFGASSTVTMSIPASGTGFFENATSTASVSTGQPCNWMIASTAVGTLVYRYIGLEFITTDNSSNLLAGCNAVNGFSQAGGNTYYYCPVSLAIAHGTAAGAEIKMPFPCTASGLFININSNSLTGTSTFKLFKNGVVTACVVSLSTGVTGLWEDAVNSVSVNANDRISFQAIAGGTGVIYWSTFALKLVTVVEPISVFGVDDITVTEFKTVLDEVVELFAFESHSATEWFRHEVLELPNIFDVAEDVIPVSESVELVRWQENGGFGWNPRPVTTTTSKSWKRVRMDASGQRIVVGSFASAGRLWRSHDAGKTWIEMRPEGDVNRFWDALAISGNGQYVLAGWQNGAGKLFLSSNYGATFSEVKPKGVGTTGYWEGACISYDGSIMYAGDGTGRLWVSTNYGATWTDTLANGAVNNEWATVECSSDGQHVIATYPNGRVFVSANAGTSWTQIYPTGSALNQNWAVDISDDGTKIIAGAGSGSYRCYLSIDSGATFTPLPVRNGQTGSFSKVSMSKDGVVMLVFEGQNIKTWQSVDSGVTWTFINPIDPTIFYINDFDVCSTGQYRVIAQGSPDYNVWVFSPTVAYITDMSDAVETVSVEEFADQFPTTDNWMYNAVEMFSVAEYAATANTRLYVNVAENVIQGTINANTQLCLHMDGANYGRLFPDSSFYNRTVSEMSVDAFDIYTAMYGEKVFGTAALYKTAQGYLVWPHYSAYNLTNKDFQIDMRVRGHSYSWTTNTYLLSKFWIGATNVFAWTFMYGNNTLIFRYSLDGTTWQTDLSVPFTPVINTWYALTVSRHDGYIRFYANGTQLGTDKYIGTASIYSGTSELILCGFRNYTTVLSQSHFYIDEFRFTVGEAINYGSSFVLPTKAFEIVGSINEFAGRENGPPELRPREYLTISEVVTDIAKEEGGVVIREITGVETPTVNEVPELYLDLLSLSVETDSSTSDFANAWLSALPDRDVSVEDYVSTSEFRNIGRNDDTLLTAYESAGLEVQEHALVEIVFVVDVADSVSVEENLRVMMFSYVDAYEEIQSAEVFYISIPQLHISGFIEDVLVTESIGLLDEVVEVGIVGEILNTPEEDVALFFPWLVVMPTYEAIITDSVAFARPDRLFLSVFDSVEGTSFAEGYPDVLVPEVSEEVFASEDAFAYPDPLVPEVAEDVTVAESAYLVDLVIEIWLVGNIVGTTEFISVGLTVLNFDVYDSVVADDWANSFPPYLTLEIEESVSVEEAFDGFFDVWNIDTYEDVLASEDPSLFFDFLHLNVYQLALVNESVSVIDLVVEIGIVVEDVNVTDEAYARLDVLVVDASDYVTVSEQENLVAPFLNLGVYEGIAIDEDVELLDIVVELALSEDVSVDEVIGVSVTELFVSVEDDSSVEEYIKILDIIIEMEGNDSVSTSESFDILIPILNVDANEYVAVDSEYSKFTLSALWTLAVETIEVVEFVQMLDIIVEMPLAYEDVSVVDEATVIMPILLVDEYDISFVAEWVQILDIIIEMYAQDSVASSEYAELVDLVIEVWDAVEDVLVSEDSSVLMPLLNVPASDDVTVSYVSEQYLDVLNASPYEEVVVIEVSDELISELFMYAEEMQMSVTEMAQILDLVIELGIVTDVVYASENVTMIPTILYARPQEDVVTVAEDATASIPLLFTGMLISEAHVSESLAVMMSVWNLDAGFEFVVVNEARSIYFLQWNIETVFEFVYWTENVAIKPMFLYVDVSEPFLMSVTEHVDVIDLVVEVAVPPEFILISEATNVSLDVLRPFMFDVVYMIGENSYVYVPMEFSIAESAFVQEVVLVEVPMKVSVVDSVTINDYAGIGEGLWFLYVEDSAVSSEWVNMLDIIVELQVEDSASISEFVDRYFTNWNVEKYEVVLVNETVLMNMPINFEAVEQKGIALVTVSGW